MLSLDESEDRRREFTALEAYREQVAWLSALDIARPAWLAGESGMFPFTRESKARLLVAVIFLRWSDAIEFALLIGSMPWAVGIGVDAVPHWETAIQGPRPQ